MIWDSVVRQAMTMPRARLLVPLVGALVVLQVFLWGSGRLDNLHAGRRQLDQVPAPSRHPAPAPTESSGELGPSPPPSPRRWPDIRYREADRSFRLRMRGTEHWVLYNLIPAGKTFGYDESVTYTTHSELNFLHNVEPLLRRWQGPMSVAIFTPGQDFHTAVESILYYRQCLNSTLVADLVTFHLFFPVGHVPDRIPTTEASRRQLLDRVADCTKRPPNVDDDDDAEDDDGDEAPSSASPNSTAKAGWKPYRAVKGIPYPINVGRNVARETASTHFIFPSDVELYPSPGLIPSFLKMVTDKPELRREQGGGAPRVFPLAIFEIEAGLEIPETKGELLDLLAKGQVVVFHKFFCAACHTVPQFDKWKKWDNGSSGSSGSVLGVSSVGKRVGKFKSWEPIYIGTNDVPWYDERLSWDGRRDKMTQGYVMCIKDYDFMVLDNAFLVHRPGIKKTSKSPPVAFKAQSKVINDHIIPEIERLYGKRKGCFLA